MGEEAIASCSAFSSASRALMASRRVCWAGEAPADGGGMSGTVASDLVRRRLEVAAEAPAADDEDEAA